MIHAPHQRGFFLVAYVSYRSGTALRPCLALGSLQRNPDTIHKRPLKDRSGSVVPDIPPELFVGPNYCLRTGGEVDDSWEFATRFFR